MSARHRFACLGLLLLVALGATGVHGAELAPQHREKLVWVDQQLQKVVTLYRDKKTDEMNKLIGDIEQALDGLKIAAEGQENLDAILNPFRARLASAHKLAAYVPPQAAVVAKPAAKPKPGEPVAGGVSFSKEIAPILVAKCGNCHVRGNRGDLSMADYASLMKGTAGQYTIIKPGQGDTSMLVEKIQSGEMPPGGNKLSDAEVMLFIKWINEGAKFDGMDQTASLYDLSPGAAAANPNAPTVVARGGANDKVQFMRDILPIFRDNCMSCHDAARAQDASGRFSMNSFQTLLRGGQDGGKPIVPGDPEASFLVKMLRGTALGPDGKTKKPKMPRRGSLEDSEMAMILDWIKDGAKFDGDSQTESLDLLFRIEVAKKATHEELTASRMADAKKLWKRSNPDSPSEVVETTDFTLIGNLGPVRMQELADQAEAEKANICSTLKLPTDKPLVKGKITLFVFDKKFEYGEFSTVGEGKPLPPGQVSHWFFNYIDCYACISGQDQTTETFGPLLTEVIVGSYLDSLGSKAPRWFAVGTARNVASQFHSKSPLVKQWQDALAPAMSAGLSAKAVLDTNTPDANVRAVSQAFVRDLMRSPSWSTLLTAIAKGTRFDGAFNSAYRASPETVFAAWGKR